jgi:hypothetical protein
MAEEHNSQLKRRDPRHTWPAVPITPDAAGPSARTAPWIAAALIQQQMRIELPEQPASAAAAVPVSARQLVQNGLQGLIAALLPSEDEESCMSCVVEAVSNAIARAPQSGAWTVARAKSVGSFEKRTNLAGT